jgi:membrane fusion protein (multidrug efflux system)
MSQNQSATAVVSPLKQNEAPAPATAPEPGAGTRKKRLIVAVIVVIALLVGGRMWWRSHYFEETDNAYLDGNVTIVSPRIAGTVQAVMVADNQRVTAGDLLVELDPADHILKVRQVMAQVAQIDAQIKQLEAQVQQSAAEVASANAEVERTAAQARRARVDASRYKDAYTEEMRAVSKQELDNAMAANDVAASGWQAQKAQASAARAKMSSVAASNAILQSQRNVLIAQLQEARLHMSYAKIYAPVSGRVGKKTVEVGSRIGLGQQMLAIVQDSVWVNANFKETQLGGLLPGQRVSVQIDAIPGQVFVGHIESFSPASGAHFALLPPDNATGNFTKIVQRVPVKVVLEPEPIAAYRERLTPGMSATVEIDLRQDRPASSGLATSKEAS